jgi:hypothetical protein
MEMDNKMLMDLQVKAIGALMAKLGVTEITLVDKDVQEVPRLLGIESDEIEISYTYSPNEGMLKLTMIIPE